MRNRTFQWFITIALLLGIVSIIIAPNESLVPTLPESGSVATTSQVHTDSGKTHHGLLKKHFQMAEDASEEENLKESDKWLPVELLLEPPQNHHQTQFCCQLFQARQCSVHYKEWHLAKRLAIVAHQSAHLLYLFHTLKLHC